MHTASRRLMPKYRYIPEVRCTYPVHTGICRYDFPVPGIAAVIGETESAGSGKGRGILGKNANPIARKNTDLWRPESAGFRWLQVLLPCTDDGLRYFRQLRGWMRRQTWGRDLLCGTCTIDILDGFSIERRPARFDRERDYYRSQRPDQLTYIYNSVAKRRMKVELG